MGRAILLLGVAVICALSLVTSRHQARQTTAAIERERQTAIVLNDQYERMLLEQSTASTGKRIDKLARDKLNMRLPTLDQIRVIEYRASPKPQ
ncbi:MAG: cell division protein FtsL [Burkholderiales bacterium]|jgi:cell division protein FtsL|nr:cell division protein FtsL [Burkholderiales bacterium]